MPCSNGWTFSEVIIVYAMVSVTEGVGSMFFEGTWRLAWKSTRVVFGRGGSARLGLLTPAVAVYCVLAARWSFRRGLRRYDGAGN